MQNYTITEAADELNITADELVNFDATLTLDSTVTADELNELREVLANTDEQGIHGA